MYFTLLAATLVVVAEDTPSATRPATPTEKQLLGEVKELERLAANQDQKMLQMNETLKKALWRPHGNALTDMFWKDPIFEHGHHQHPEIPPVFTFCHSYNKWFLFLCIMFGLCSLVILRDIATAVMGLDEGEEDDQSATEALSNQEQINMFDRPISCNFLNVLRTLENWQATDCMAPPKAALYFQNGPRQGEVDDSKPAALRTGYEFRVHTLLHWKFLAQTVLSDRTVWLKAWFLASLAGILAYIAQDAIYRGEERYHRFLMGIATMARSLAFLTMLLLTTYVFRTVAR